MKHLKDLFIERSAQDGTGTHFLDGLYDTWLIND
jgi:hypothetical protein